MTDRATRGKRANALGHDAEAAAARLLQAEGARILATRHRTPHGEIDIIAEEPGTLVFVEVKARRDRDTAATAITPRQWQRLEAAALHVMSVYHTDTSFAESAARNAAPDLRFDVVLVARDGRAERIVNARHFDEW